ncbi:MAG: hypothetical protein ACI8TX_000520 [Hyphomicrobiaceae bacterium]
MVTVVTVVTVVTAVAAVAVTAEAAHTDQPMPPSLLALLATAVLAMTPLHGETPSLQRSTTAPLSLSHNDAGLLVVELDGGRGRAALDPLLLRQSLSLSRAGLEQPGILQAYGAAELVSEIAKAAPELVTEVSSGGIPDDAAEVERLIAHGASPDQQLVFDSDLQRVRIHFAHDLTDPRAVEDFRMALVAHADRHLSPPLRRTLAVVSSTLAAQPGDRRVVWLATALFAALALAPSLVRTGKARAAAMYPSAAALLWIAADRGSGASMSMQTAWGAVALATLGLVGIAIAARRTMQSSASIVFLAAILSASSGCVAVRFYETPGIGTEVPITRSAETRADADPLGAREDPRESAGLIIVEVPEADLHDITSPPHDQLGIPAERERELAAQINAYRARHGMRSVPWSRSLTHVARLHARDLALRPPSTSCMIHSWSDAGAWTPCCYTSDHSQARCMWNKPIELTAYRGVGFEVAYMHTAGVRAEKAVKAWRESELHRAVLLNRGKWADNAWRAMGVGIHGDYAVLWFGQDWDPAGYWRGAEY